MSYTKQTGDKNMSFSNLKNRSKESRVVLPKNSIKLRRETVHTKMTVFGNQQRISPVMVIA